MTNDAIVKLIELKANVGKALNIHFKARATITGLFIKTNDYESLKSRNLWRVVRKDNMEEWKKSNDINLCRIFNGSEFTRISEAD